MNFAILQAGLPRTTGDVAFLMEAIPENERRVFEELATERGVQGVFAICGLTLGDP